MRDGIVQAYDVLALPTFSRWGGTLIGAYVNERSAPYNLLDAVFSRTDEGVLSLATLRDGAGQPFDFQVVHHNEGASRLLKVPTGALLWRRLSAGENLLCLPEVIERLRNVASNGNSNQFEIDSDDRNLKLGVTAFGDILSLTVTDVTSLKRREASFRLLFDNNPMPMWVFDVETMYFLNVNDAAIRHYGYSREKFLSMKLQDIWPQDEWNNHTQALQQIGDKDYNSGNWRHLKADGSVIEVLTYGRRVPFGEREAFLVAVVDITERRRAEARIAHMAHHDGLTNLPNRALFQERLKKALEQAEGNEARGGAVHRSRPVQERQRFLRSSDRRPLADNGRRAAAIGSARQQSRGPARR